MRKRFDVRRLLLALVVLLLTSIPIGIVYEVAFGGFVDVRYLGFAFALAFILAVLRAALPNPQKTDNGRTRFCPACGYDLTGNTSGVCPECGRKIGSPETSTETSTAPPGA